MNNHINGHTHNALNRPWGWPSECPGGIICIHLQHIIIPTFRTSCAKPAHITVRGVTRAGWEMPWRLVIVHSAYAGYYLHSAKWLYWTPPYSFGVRRRRWRIYNFHFFYQSDLKKTSQYSSHGQQWMTLMRQHSTSIVCPYLLTYVRYAGSLGYCRRHIYL